MPKFPMQLPSGEIGEADFPWDEVERRAMEIIRRSGDLDPKSGNRRGQYKDRFSLETGQNYEGEQLSAEELKRRGY
jgi:hypothetical protein